MQADTIQSIQASAIHPGHNDRTTFDPTRLSELATSIREHTLLQPISVRMVNDGQYQIIAGERRYRAMTDVLEWTFIPCRVVSVDDETASALMLAENMARTDLDPIDEATAYQTRMDLYGWTVTELAQRAGVSATRVQFRLKLLRLDATLQEQVRRNVIPLGYAQTIADARLDNNRQYAAIRALNANPSPTPSWFRGIVGSLLAEQQQMSIFEVGYDVAPTLEDPPTPYTSKAPVNGDTPHTILRGQADFWRNAATAWDRMGKNFKRQECEAAALALESALAAI